MVIGLACLSRDGQPENALREVVYCCQRPLPEKGGVKPTQLFSRNADVDRVNTAELAGLPHPQATSFRSPTAQSTTPCTLVHRSWQGASTLLLICRSVWCGYLNRSVYMALDSRLLKQWLRPMSSP